MASNPEPHPLDEEMDAIYEADPELAAELDEMEDQLDRDELPYAEDDEARLLLGLPLGDR